MATFLEMKQYVERPKKILTQGGVTPIEHENQRLRQPEYGWCARVCLDIAIAYALQKTIRNLNEVNPNLTQSVVFDAGKRGEHRRNILKGGFAEQIYNTRSQWKNGGLFSFTEVDINSAVKTVMAKNKLWKRADGKKRLAPVFTEHKEGTITSKLSKVVKFLEEETPTTIGVTYSSLRVCLLQFVNSKKHTRHECIACGTNKDERNLDSELVPTLDIYNPWGHIIEDIDPNNLYSAEKTMSEEVKMIIRDIFNLQKDAAINYSLEAIRLFSFKWWEKKQKNNMKGCLL